MNKPEIAELLTIASGFDRFIAADIPTITAWHLVLAEVPMQEAVDAVVAHATGPNAHQTLQVRHILEAVKRTNRLNPAQVEADARSARTRGIVDKDWPLDKPLNQDALERLVAARKSELDERTAVEERAGIGRAFVEHGEGLRSA